MKRHVLLLGKARYLSRGVLAGRGSGCEAAGVGCSRVNPVEWVKCMCGVRGGFVNWDRFDKRRWG